MGEWQKCLRDTHLYTHHWRKDWRKQAKRETRLSAGLQLDPYLERETGLEPATFCLGSRYSTTELLPLSSMGGYSI